MVKLTQTEKEEVKMGMEKKKRNQKKKTQKWKKKERGAVRKTELSLSPLLPQ